MGRSQKSKRITWASDVNLCQVKLFLSEESPSKVGTGDHDHLQKMSFQSNSIDPDDNLPPGFEGFIKSSQIPSIKWRCPPKFEINLEWQVVAGEESKEVEAQKQREMRVLEAIYPRPPTIPPNPSRVAGMDDSTSNYQNTPVVPLTPIEDDESSQYANELSTTIPKPDTVKAPRIDTDLLFKILSNPKMIEQLVSRNEPFSSFQSMPAIGVKRETHNLPATNTQYVQPFEQIKNAVNQPATGPFCPPQIRTSTPSPSVVKDVNYYKSLIQQHGEERRDFNLPQFDHRSNQEPVSFVRSKPRIMKPCVYFSSSRGCRNGANCNYQHDVSSGKRIGGFAEVQSVKRVKLDRGITGI